ncbi:MAG: DUF5615 family PIN-like protein [Longimicrobiales bacterium]
MNLVCDEGVERQIVEQLREDGHSVVYVAELDPSIPDPDVLALSVEQAAPLVTNDKDFGELVYRQRLASTGVVLLRLAGLSATAKSAAVSRAVRDHAADIPGSFTVVSPGHVRMRRAPD